MQHLLNLPWPDAFNASCSCKQQLQVCTWMFGIVADTATKRTLAIGNCIHSKVSCSSRLLQQAAAVTYLATVASKGKGKATQCFGAVIHITLHTRLISFLLLTILILEIVPVSSALPLFSLNRCTCTRQSNVAGAHLHWHSNSKTGIRNAGDTAELQ